MFDKLGTFETSKWYVVVAIWILIVIIAAPFTSLFFHSVSNQITISIPGSTAQQAQQIVSKDFHIGGASSASALLFIQGNISQYSGFFANFTKYGNASISDFFTIEKGILNSSITKGLNATEILAKTFKNISSQEIQTEGKLNYTYTNLTAKINGLEKLNSSAYEVESKFVNVSSTLNSTSKKLEALHQEGLGLERNFTYLKGNETELNSTVETLSKLEYGVPLTFLKVWENAYNETKSVNLANGIAFMKIYQGVNGTARQYFVNFDSDWNSSFRVGDNPYLVALNLIPEAVNQTFSNTKEYNLAIGISKSFNFSDFQNVTTIQDFVANLFNQTYHVPTYIAKSLLVESSKNVTLEILHQKTNISYPILMQTLSSENFTGIAAQILESKVNASGSQFIEQVYLHLNYTPLQFAISYLSSVSNVSPTIVKEVLTSNSTGLIFLISNEASNKTGIPSWFYVSLLRYKDLNNLTVYLFSSHLNKLDSLLSKTNMTTKQLAEELLNSSQDYPLAASLISRSFSNASPELSVNVTLLYKYLLKGVKENATPASIVYSAIVSNKFPVEPVERVKDQLYNGSYLLVAISGNVTYKETQEIQQYVQSHIPSFTGKIYLTGSKPVSHVIGNIGSSAFAIAIPVGIALAIILTGIYFRSIIAALLPLTIYLAAYVVASDIIYLIVIKILGITVDFLTPSQVLLLALGLGTDYVVFMASRYIEEREKGLEKNDAVIETVKWGGKAVTITAFVVALSFLFIYIYNVPFFSDTAIAEMLAVIVIWLTSITLFPSLLTAIGDKLFFPRKIREKKEKEVKGKYSNAGVKAGIVVAIVIISVIGAMGTPLTFNILGLLPSSPATEGINVLSQTLTTANVFPICVVIPGNFSYSTAHAIYENLSNIPGVTAIQSPVSPDGFLVNQSSLKNYNYTEYISHGYMLFVVNQKYPPFSNNAFQVVHDVIQKVGKSGYVGGGPVDSYNILNFVNTDFFTIVALISITMYIILVIVTRSFPIAGIILFTILSAVAITLAVERVIFESVGIFAVIPLILVAIIIGIGMDYNIFLVARIHEELEKGLTMEEAAHTTVKRIGTTITFLGLIFAGTLGSLMLVHAAILQEIGFALAVAAILETTLLWRYLAPSLIVLVYRKLKSRPKMIV
ncbi:MMPL family transporter [Sulfuracidifex metallicus]|uniref:MMPL family transporter n=1 Tax=Sulfuracidifex metallicus TaxID=47303 RepID=UPI002274CA37|nr:MMPL family transporter [Sulfuracidifex metallicus]MCY0850789.1 MMPL family transporter [Sulfuracidifex metallicus]